MTATTTGRIGRIALGDVIGRTARTCGDEIALVDEDVRISYRELDEESDRFARFLLTQGMQGGDRVAMVCVNSYRFVIAMFGILKAGFVWVPINTMLAPSDIAYIAEHAEAKLVLIDEPLFANTVLRAALEAVVPRVVVVPSNNDPATQSHTEPSPPCHPDPSTSSGEGCAADFDTVRAAQPTGEVDIEIADRDLALIMYTSGTTGRPKGVMHTHLSVFTAALSNLADLPMRRGEATPLLLPMFHCATHAIMLTGMLVGARGIIFRGFDAVRMMTAFEREHVTFAFLLPAMWSAILDHPDRAKYDLSSLRLGLYAMAPISEPVRRRLIAEICPNFQLSSGQTEMYPATVVFRPDEQLRRFGNYWGTSTPVDETAIMDDDGNLLDRGQVGEIVHRGPNVMEGYFKDPEATTAARRFDWHHTGDLGMFDEDGQLLFVDRKKDLIKSGGENVASVKVEAVLLAHSAVASAGVVGVPHEHWGEAVVGFVALKPGTTATEDDLIAHCRERLAGFETPKAVRILDRLPMTATGKVQKHALRAQTEIFAESAV